MDRHSAMVYWQKSLTEYATSAYATRTLPVVAVVAEVPPKDTSKKRPKQIEQSEAKSEVANDEREDVAELVYQPVVRHSPEKQPANKKQKVEEIEVSSDDDVVMVVTNPKPKPQPNEQQRQQAMQPLTKKEQEERAAEYNLKFGYSFLESKFEKMSIGGGGLQFAVKLNALKLHKGQSMQHAHVCMWLSGGALVSRHSADFIVGAENAALKKVAETLGASRTVIAPVSVGGNVSVVLEADPAFLTSSLDDLALHFEVIVTEKVAGMDAELKPVFVRRGGCFVPLRMLTEVSQSEAADFSMHLWDGPVDPGFEIASAPYRLTCGMTFDRVGKLSVSQMSGALLENISMQPAAAAGGGAALELAPKEPLSILSPDEESAVCKYLKLVADIYRAQGVMDYHSFVYVNLPTRSIIPLPMVMFLPPMSVTMEVYEARLNFQLQFCEHMAADVFERVCNVAMGEDATVTSAGMQKWCWTRLMWILAFALNPFNMVLYRLDTYNGASAESMGYPKYAVGDCEDTAEAAQRFIRGLMLYTENDAEGPAMRALMRFVSHYVIAQAVLTTKSASFAGSGAHSGPALHMMSMMMPRSYFVGARAAPHAPLLLPFPIEGTGLNGNMDMDPRAMFPGDERTRDTVVSNLRAYAAVRDKMMAFDDIKLERGNVPSVNVGGNGKEDLWKRAETGFYRQVVSVCHDPALNKGGFPFADLAYKPSSGKKGMVSYKDVVSGGHGSLWGFVPPQIDMTDAERKLLTQSCIRAARHIQPIPLLDHALTMTGTFAAPATSNKQTDTPSVTGESDDPFLQQTLMTRLCCYVNCSAYPDPDAIISRIAKQTRRLPGVKSVDVGKARIMSGALTIAVISCSF